jgi:hypothetical protein
MGDRSTRLNPASQRYEQVPFPPKREPLDTDKWQLCIIYAAFGRTVSWSVFIYRSIWKEDFPLSRVMYVLYLHCAPAGVLSIGLTKAQLLHLRYSESRCRFKENIFEERLQWKNTQPLNYKFKQFTSRCHWQKDERKPNIAWTFRKFARMDVWSHSRCPLESTSHGDIWQICSHGHLKLLVMSVRINIAWRHLTNLLAWTFKVTQNMSLAINVAWGHLTNLLAWNFQVTQGVRWNQHRMELHMDIWQICSHGRSKSLAMSVGINIAWGHLTNLLAWTFEVTCDVR